MDSLSSKEDVKAAMQSIDDLKQQIRSFVNLEHLKVPMIVYLGGSLILLTFLLTSIKVVSL